MALGDILQSIRKLRVNPGSPHKPVMLLSVLQLFEEGRVRDNHLEFDNELLDVYRELFKIVATPRDHPNPHFPFFHLSKDSRDAHFWILVPVPGQENILAAKDSLRSPGELRRLVAHARLSDDLYALLHDPLSRFAIKDELLARWFPSHRTQLEEAMRTEKSVSDYMLVLRENVEAERPSPPPPLAEQPCETRDRAFCRIVRDAYDSRCAASGWRIILPDGSSMVEAAHLVPFSESHDDDPRNGIALSPTFHWALDRHLIAPGPDLKWHVSKTLDRRIRDNAELLEYEGKPLLLPQSRKYWPKQESLAWRMERLLAESR